jgi:membrane-bound lytic murein transglycosylase D
MKKPPVFHLTVGLVFWVLFRVQAQNAPVAPSESIFGGIKISLSTDAQSLVQSEINALWSNRSSLENRLERCSVYFPVIDQILKDNDVPADFRYVALMESGFQADSREINGQGIGFWSFKKETAQDFGLRTDDVIEERRNLHASTRAAALYLKRNQEVLNNWVATLSTFKTSLKDYNKIVPRQWAFAAEIKLEGLTHAYVSKVLAHRIVFEEMLKDYVAKDRQFFVYEYAAGKTFGQIASEIGMTEKELRRYNSWANVTQIPDDKEYSLLVPATQKMAEKLQEKVANLSTKVVGENTEAEIMAFPTLKRITEENVSKNQPIFYEINGKKGIMATTKDDAESLANKGGISTAKFLSYNDIDNFKKIIPDKIYYLERKEKKANVPFHTALAGQDLWEVSQMYGLKLEKVLEYNRMEHPQRLQAGRVLWLSKIRPEDTPIEVIQSPEMKAESVSQKSERNLQNINGVVVADLYVQDSQDAGIQMFESERQQQNFAQYIERKDVIHHVRKGENYYAIARRYGVRVQDVYAWNHVKDESKLLSGKKLIIKLGL